MFILAAALNLDHPSDASRLSSCLRSSGGRVMMLSTEPTFRSAEILSALDARAVTYDAVQTRDTRETGVVSLHVNSDDLDVVQSALEDLENTHGVAWACDDSVRVERNGLR